MGHFTEWASLHGYTREEANNALSIYGFQVRGNDDLYSPFADAQMSELSIRTAPRFGSRIEAVDHAARLVASGRLHNEIDGGFYTAAPEDENQVDWNEGRIVTVEIPLKRGMNALEIYKAAVTKAERGKKINPGEVAEPDFSPSKSFYEAVTIKRTRTRKVATTEGKKVTKYFVVKVGSDHLPEWSEGFDTVSEAKKHFPEFTKSETVAGHGPARYEFPDAEYEIIGVSKRESGAGLARTETTKKSEVMDKPVFRVHLLVGKKATPSHFQTTIKKGETGWVFWADIHH